MGNERIKELLRAAFQVDSRVFQRESLAGKELSEQGICCWSGNDDQMHQSRHHYGAVGVISVT